MVYIKKLNGYVIRDEEAYNKAQSIIDGKDANGVEVKAAIATKAKTVQINQTSDRADEIALVGVQYGTSGEASDIYTTGGLVYNTEYGGLSATEFIENNQKLSDKYATKTEVTDAVASAGKVNSLVVGGTSISPDSNKVVTINTDGTYNSTSNKLATQSTVTNALKGYTKSYTFKNLAALKTALSDASDSAYKVGDALYIVEKDVPDYWVAVVNTTHSSSSAIVDPPGYNIGYYTIYELEVAKVELNGNAATVERRTSLPVEKDRVDQRIYLLDGVTESFTGSEYVSNPGELNYSTSIGVTINPGLSSVSAASLTLGCSVEVVSGSYDSTTGGLTLKIIVPANHDGIVNYNITAVGTSAEVGGIWKDNEFSYFKTYKDATEANKVTVLQKVYKDGELILFVENENEAYYSET